MASLYTQQSKNLRRTWIIMGLFLGVVVAVGWFASIYFGNPVVLIIAVVVAIGMNATSFWYSDTIAITSARAKRASKDEYQELHRLVENLAITAGLPKPQVYVIQDAAPNAFATGRNPKHASIAVTTGLLKVLNKTELEGVLAHELSHIGNRDILVMSVAVVLVGFIAVITDIAWRLSFFGGGGNRDRGGNGIMLVVGIVLVILAPIVARLMQLAVSRKREFLADASGALLTRYPEGLASALEKISGYGAPMQHASGATSHLFISNPFGSGKGKKGGGLMRKLFSTHPPMEERIAALLN